MTTAKFEHVDVDVPGSAVPTAAAAHGGADLFKQLATWLELDFPSLPDSAMTTETSFTSPDKYLPSSAESSYRHPARSTDRPADQGHQEVQCLPLTTNY